jgi:hypothetical protein
VGFPCAKGSGQGGSLAGHLHPRPRGGPPAGVKPVEWRLLTNREAGSFEAAAEIIDWYRARWEIELFFNVLTNACRTVRTGCQCTSSSGGSIVSASSVSPERVLAVSRAGIGHPGAEQ